MDARENIRALVATFKEAKIPFMAASIAYFAFISILPLLLLTLAIGSFLGEEAFAAQVVGLVEDGLSAEGAAVIEEALTSPAGRQGASFISAIALAWSALKVFRTIDVAFDEVYGFRGATSLVEQVINGITVIATVALGVILMIGLGTMFGRPDLVDVPYIDVFGWLLLLVGLTIVFLPFYYIMPPIDVSVREILPGTATAAFGWILLQGGFQIYAANAGQYQAYGFLGAVLLFMIWLYFAGILMLVGAAINAVLADRTHHGRETATGPQAPVSSRS